MSRFIGMNSMELLRNRGGTAANSKITADFEFYQLLFWCQIMPQKLNIAVCRRYGAIYLGWNTKGGGGEG